MKRELLDILTLNKANDKVTYELFQSWHNDHKKVILSLMELLWYHNNAHKEKYFGNMMKIFYEINKIVGQYNRDINNPSQILKIYEGACEVYIRKNEDNIDISEAPNIIKRYKSYRGMSKLKDYGWDLKNQNLRDRTVQYMRQNSFETYINSDEAEIDWAVLQEKYNIQNK